VLAHFEVPLRFGADPYSPRYRSLIAVRTISASYVAAARPTRGHGQLQCDEHIRRQQHSTSYATIYSIHGIRESTLQSQEALIGVVKCERLQVQFHASCSTASHSCPRRAAAVRLFQVAALCVMRILPHASHIHQGPELQHTFTVLVPLLCRFAVLCVP
jgi:hypothetical protein